MDKKPIVKAVLNNLTAYGVGAAIGGTIQNAIPRHNNPVINLAVAASAVVTGHVVAGMVHEKCVDYIDRKVDDYATKIADLKFELHLSK